MLLGLGFRVSVYALETLEVASPKAPGLFSVSGNLGASKALSEWSQLVAIWCFNLGAPIACCARLLRTQACGQVHARGHAFTSTPHFFDIGRCCNALMIEFYALGLSGCDLGCDEGSVMLLDVVLTNVQLVQKPIPNDYQIAGYAVNGLDCAVCIADYWLLRFPMLQNTVLTHTFQRGSWIKKVTNPNTD